MGPPLAWHHTDRMAVRGHFTRLGSSWSNPKILEIYIDAHTLGPGLGNECVAQISAQSRHKEKIQTPVRVFANLKHIQFTAIVQWLGRQHKQTKDQSSPVPAQRLPDQQARP